MSEQTLLIILVGMLALSWLAVAVVVTFVGLRLLRVLDELSLLANRLRIAGDAAAADMQELRARVREEGTKLRGIVDLLLGFVSRTLRAPKRRSRKAAPVDDE
jgi:hypothetical protein